MNKKTIDEKIKWMIYGFLYGIIFPVLALIIDYFFIQHQKTAFFLLFRNNPLHWIILSAPVVLGMTALLIGINRNKVKKALKLLAKNSLQMIAASTELTNSAEKISKKADEQEGIINETIGILEKLSMIINLNAENSNLVSQFLEKTKDLMTNTEERINKMSMAINDIASSGGKIKNIIKIIDEIAFQTNLLALNAAVEAARAGEAGAGFGVVSQEVKNLASRSAQQANNIQLLVEEITEKINTGNIIMEGANESFTEVIGSTDKTGNRLKEVIVSSDEQKKYIEKIKNTMENLSKVSQNNTEQSKKTAETAEKLNTQADTILEVAKELNKITIRNKHKTSVQGSETRLLPKASQ
ncbi:MAG: hypothetical protein KKH98_09045 [Spirochaetes bacterium]|nr:hypothetical protein [Spirochaetota bacterium]